MSAPDSVWDGVPIPDGPWDIRVETIVRNVQGVHGRPSARIAETVKASSSQVFLVAGGRAANARDLMELLALAMRDKTCVEILARGLDAAVIAERVAQILAPDPRHPWSY